MVSVITEFLSCILMLRFSACLSIDKNLTFWSIDLCKQGVRMMKKVVFGFCFILLITSFVWATDASDVTVIVLAKSTQSWDGKPLPAYGEGQPEVTLLKITIPPKTKLDMHEHGVINAGVLLKGELKVITEADEILTLKAGDALIEVVNKWHYGINEGIEPAEIIVFYAGIVDQAITVKK